MFTPDTIKKVAALAVEIKVEPAALLAVAEVESAGVTEWPVGGKNLPPIRFEGHYFYRLLPKVSREAAIKAGLASPKAGVIKNPSTYQARYDLLERAIRIDTNAALASTSWGLGQVMGDHWSKLGYASVRAMVGRARAGVDGQVEIMGRYISKFGLTDELQTMGWQSFADQYNGPASRKNRYASKIAAAYKRYSAVNSWGEAGVSYEKPFTEQQKSLQWLGFFTGAIDGQNSTAFRDALRAFQVGHGLVPDGKWGPLSSEALDKALAEKQASQGDVAAKAGGSVATGAAAIEVINATVGQLQPVADIIGSNTLHWVVAGLVIVAAGIGIIGLYKKRKAG